MNLPGVQGVRTEQVGIGVQGPIEAPGSKPVCLVCPGAWPALRTFLWAPQRKLFDLSQEASLSPGNLEGGRNRNG